MLFKMNTSHLILIALTSILYTCGQRTDNSKKLKIEIPDTTESELDILPLLYKDRLAEELNLERLENGVDSFELRFDTRIAVLKCGFGQMLVFKKKGDSWSCFEYQYIVQD